MACDGTYTTAEYKDPGMSLRLWMGCPSIMEEILMIQIVRTPVILIMRLGWDWCDSDTPDRYCGFFPDDEEIQLPVIVCTLVFRGGGGDMDEPLRLRPDSWDASVSVTDINSDPV